MSGDQSNGTALAHHGGDSFRPIVEFEVFLPERQHRCTGKFYEQFVGTTEYVQPDTVDSAQSLGQLSTHPIGVIR
ncbi:uncharacterized protein METZ01_LOCUS437070 [marine metagenome]|uniref:Uncharacterized protein n=1 Tax=marine metagenome TaxID=408172 RepID=A0A382YLP4_9ZZZZ